VHAHWGNSEGDEFGYAVAFIGDVNNDKHDDYAVSVRRQGTNATGQPSVHTYDGKTGKLLSAGTVTEPIDQLRRLGDVNGDGRLDLLATTSKKGKKVLLLSVHPQTKALYGSVAGTYDIRTFLADGPLDAGLDVNKDGAADFVLGFPSSGSTNGQAFVYSAKDGKLIHTLKPQASSPTFGSAVALVDDLNGDGHVDILVGDPNAPIPNWYYFGVVFAYSGRTGELLFTIAERDVNTKVLGTGISVIGDLNGDKLPEVAIERKDGWVIYDLRVGGPYGQGCGSTATPPSLRTDLPPRIAGSFALDASNMLTNTSGVLVIGLSDKLWGTQTLPLGLGFMGMPRCQLLCSWDTQIGFTTTTGSWQPRFKVPKNFNLLGVPIYNQVWALDPKANFPGIATSNAVRNFVKQ
jgi:hypothetical protein